MSKNKVQFQVGFSALEFIDHFGTEEQCVKYLEKLKWPNGFKCEKCGHHGDIIYLVFRRGKQKNGVSAGGNTGIVLSEFPLF